MRSIHPSDPIIPPKIIQIRELNPSLPMRHILLIPASLIALFIVVSMFGMAEQHSLTGETGLGMLGGIEFVLLMILEAIILGAWFVCCEIASLRAQSVESDASAYTSTDSQPQTQENESDDSRIWSESQSMNTIITIIAVVLVAAFIVAMVRIS